MVYAHIFPQKEVFTSVNKINVKGYDDDPRDTELDAVSLIQAMLFSHWSLRHRQLLLPFTHTFCAASLCTHALRRVSFLF